MFDSPALSRLSAAIRSLVTRGKVVRSGISSRSVILVDALANEQFPVELLLPPGMSARPKVGGDVLLFQVLGTRDHVVALGGDSTGQAIADLSESEFGFALDGVRIVWRTDRIEITTTSGKMLEVVADGPVSITSQQAVTVTSDESVTLTSPIQIELNAPSVTINGDQVATV